MASLPSLSVYISVAQEMGQDCTKGQGAESSKEEFLLMPSLPGNHNLQVDFWFKE
jgi:hypothetical protein